jgi:hypothetical protein
VTALNTENPPTEIYFITNGIVHGLYWASKILKGALKTSSKWTLSVKHPSYYRYTKIPYPGLKIMRSEIGSASGWVDVTEQFVKDGKWAW